MTTLLALLKAPYAWAGSLAGAQRHPLSLPTTGRRKASSPKKQLFDRPQGLTAVRSQFRQNDSNHDG
jgi:hypothetical protein